MDETGRAEGQLSGIEVRDLRGALLWEAAAANLAPDDALAEAFDRACVRAATRGGRYFGPEHPRSGVNDSGFRHTGNYADTIKKLRERDRGAEHG
jgi:hypothetical protein